ncbi:MFS transporter [Janibacter cremeus]|uniref:Putative MFS family arabinose efflux permease n=1 Tax=Janibacter cremeus TaxID=1285192 RepID=A0A852VLD9_9MICO|nr:MFS transporter [Janibacter cremeus]NYF96886.1 putative MFS family arabinose efflux permease [Janibacter cremeus]
MRQGSLAHTRSVVTPSSSRIRSIWITLAALLAAGWSTNHFAALLPVLAEVAHISKPGLDAAFGLYALGLLPGLLLGGGLSDRRGRRPVVLTGLVLCAAGNVVMLLWPTLAGVLIGRLVVGAGVGLVASAGTAWAADQDWTKGAARAGVVLTTGFAAGPLASGLIGQFTPGRIGLVVAFTVPVLLTGLSALLCLFPDHASVVVPVTKPHQARVGSSPPFVEDRRIGPALAAAVPMGLWVFSCVTVAMIVLTERIGGQYGGPMLPAVAAVLALGTGILVQLGTRRLAGWRPLGVVGAGLAAIAFVISGVAGGQMSIATFVLCSLIFGAAYGLCLGQGLRDVDRLAPRSTRGLVIGIFYVVTYTGFALPFVLNTYEDTIGASAPMVVLAGLAAASALARLVQARRGDSRHFE